MDVVVSRRLGFVLLAVLIALAACSDTAPTSETRKRAWCAGAVEGAASAGGDTQTPALSTIDECVDRGYPTDPDQDSGFVPGIVYAFSRERSDAFNYCLGYAWGRGRDQSAMVECLNKWNVGG